MDCGPDPPLLGRAGYVLVPLFESVDLVPAAPARLARPDADPIPNAAVPFRNGAAIGEQIVR